MALIDVVEWKNKKDEVIYRFPVGAVSLGAQLIVAENQEAVFFREGQALDSFGPGRHTLKTGNIPILEKIINIPFGGKSPFPAEIYFVNKTEIPNLKWGTKSPMQIMERKFNLPVPIRAFGNYSIRIQDIKPFLIMAIGTWQAFTTEDIGTALRDQLILPKLQDLIAEFIIKQNIMIFDLVAYYDEIGSAARAKIVEDFSNFGVELVRFAVESINIPEDDETVQRLKKALADKAEINIMGGDDYKMRRTFDTMEKAAENDGGAGNMMGAGMGFGMGTQMSNMMGQAMGAAQQPQQAGQTQVNCPSCQAPNPAGAKFCSVCGKPMVTEKVCPSCQAKVPAASKFCPSCGAAWANQNVLSAVQLFSPVQSSARSAARPRHRSKELFMAQMNCSSCGAPLEVTNRFSKVLVCSYCGTHLKVQGDSLSESGKYPKLADFPSILEIGKGGTILGKPFTALGRMQYKGDGYRYNEWFIELDGDTAWLTEDEGTFTLFTEMFDAADIPDINSIRPGQNIDVAGRRVMVKEKGTASVEGGEGELYYYVKPEQR
jgi:membrane protease subunit (stomatin/prohibitin family)